MTPHPVSCTVRLSTGDSAGALQLFCVDADTSPSGSEDATPGSRACAHVRAFLAGSGGPASWARFGAPHLFLWPFLVPSLSARPLSGWGRPVCGFSCFLPPLRPPCLRHFVFSDPGCLGPWRLVPPPPLLVFLFLPSSAPPLSPAFRVFQPWVPWALAPRAPPPPCLWFFLFFLSLFSPQAPPLPQAIFVFRPWRPLALAPCAPPHLFFFFSFFFVRAVVCVLCGAAVVCPGPWGVLLPVVLPVPGRAVLAAALAPALHVVFAGCAPPPLPVAVSSVVLRLALCRVAPRSVAHFVLCPVVFGVLVSGWVLAPCCLARCCTGPCCAVLVLLCCPALLRSLLVPGSELVQCCFCFCALLLRCCAGVPASLLCMRCSLAFAALAGVWCCCLLCFMCLMLGLTVLCCLLVGPGGSWCRVSVVCCGVSLNAVLHRVAARCAAWRRVVVRCVVWFCSKWCRALCCVLGRCPSSWAPMPLGAFFCLVPPRRL